VRDAIALYPATAPLGAADAADAAYGEARVSLLLTSSSLAALVLVLVIILIFG
jgi:hypothetical protein